jgi:Fic family protein
LDAVYPQGHITESEGLQDMKGAMRERKAIKLGGWKDINPIYEQPREIPEGYSRVSDIAKVWGISISAARQKLRFLRESGKIECMQVRQGKVTCWVYKD